MRAAQIAIVDDDASVRKALARLLSFSDFIPRTYDSARRFLDSLSDQVPECLILDLHMPEMTGLELQVELARIGLKIPTVVITAHSDAGFRESCRAAGAAAYLVKPLDEASLLTAVNSAIQQRSAMGATEDFRRNTH